MTYEEFIRDTIKKHEKEAPYFSAWTLTGERRSVARKAKPPVDTVWYQPEHPNGRLPALINFHGGGFTACDAVQTGSFCKMLSDRIGAVVVSVNYKKAPERPFPYAIDEGCDVVLHMIDNAETLNVDVNRICVIGQSAGASIAASVAMKLANEKGVNLAYEALIYPCTDLTGDCVGRIEFSDEWLNHSIKAYIADADTHDPYLCQMTAPKEMLEKLCPTLILTCDDDELQIDGESYARRLVEAHIPVTLWRVNGTQHGYLEVNRPDWGQPDARINPKQAALARIAEDYIVKQLMAQL